MTEQEWADHERDVAHEAEHDDAMTPTDLPALREAVDAVLARAAKEQG